MRPYALPRAFSVPYATANEDHQELVGFLNQLAACVTEGESDTLAQIIDRFVLTLQCHFASDEKLMDEVAYPRLEEHRTAHCHCIERISSALEQVKACGRIERETLDDIFATLVDVVARVDLYFRDFLVGVGRIPEQSRFA
jgi:hemerythrin-like metal-binding protein